jgi:hypothetical protein
MMTMRKFTIAFALAVLTAVPAVSGELLVDALETYTGQFELPRSDDATVRFQRCGTCAFQTARATGDTIYQLYGQRVTLAELRSALAGKQAALAVLYRVKDNTLVRISAY